MSIVIRTLDEMDSIAELTALLHASYAELGAMGFNYTAVDQPETVTRARIGDGECYVAADGRRLVGTIAYHRRSNWESWIKQPHVASFGQFGVLPPYQRQGLGARLMTLVERRAMETGATELALTTSVGAGHLIRWYQRLGYRVVENVQLQGKTYRSVIMSKSLG